MSKKKTEKECQILPKVSKPKLLECCALPDFFKSDVRETCVSECSDSDADQDPWCCMTTCAMEETELGSNGTINKASVKKYFYDIFISIEIRKMLDKTLTKCENESPDSQTEHCDHPEYGTILSCIHHELFKTCIMAKTDPICQKIKNFIKKCPSRKDELFDSK
ncbi:unnamed protein product [Chironomus riparius]|uniref:Uncharacterized protein n=1 Tax=Chironomus riparius TaxID=315576 RepID=A0A9N9S0D3_9DIPT|nr:unnamed protein product [Chironomus riparius]